MAADKPVMSAKQVAFDSLNRKVSEVSRLERELRAARVAERRLRAELADLSAQADAV